MRGGVLGGYFQGNSTETDIMWLTEAEPHLEGISAHPRPYRQTLLMRPLLRLLTLARLLGSAGLSFALQPPTRVVASLNNFVGDHCVDIFVRDDGTFGLEKYRRDPEDMRGWFPLHRYSNQVFAAGQEAQVQAKATVAWMASDSR